ncbi:MAG TPA: recombinase family protein [candidate division Zixibacteria bacterium]|nr:recombinase family protein [Verrucomicrobiota bacterium]HPM37784.1 recombinase family protein [candidate division Zixibacteria bacterium]
MRCAIYARYSSDRQNDRSIEQQVRNCRKRAQERGWTIAEEHIYADRAVSGTSTEGREALHRLIRAACQRPRSFDRVLIDDTSRLARNKLDLFQSVEDLKEAGVYVHFVSDNIDTEDETTEDVILPVFGIKDALYSRDLAKKTRRGMEDQVLQGYNPGGRTYGYRYEPVLDQSGARDSKTGQTRRLGTAISVDPVQARVIRLIFSLYASGHGLKNIAENLNEQGIKPPGERDQRRRGNRNPSWCPNAIRNMLRNPKYIGDWTWNKNRYVRKRSTGKRVPVERPREEWIEHKDSKLAIVDQATWDAVRARFVKSAEQYKRGEQAPRSTYLMSGLLKCGICGANLIVVRTGSPKNIQYGCSFNWHRGSAVCPNNIRIRRQDIEDRAMRAIKMQLFDADVIDLLVAKVNAVIESKLKTAFSERDRIARQIVAVNREIENLVGYIARTGNASPSVQQTLMERERQLADLNARLESVSRRETAKKIKVDSRYISSWFKRLEELIESDPLAARHEIGKIIGQLTAYPAEEDGRKGLELCGKPHVEGILGVVAGVSTPNNGGGRI